MSKFLPEDAPPRPAPFPQKHIQRKQLVPHLQPSSAMYTSSCSMSTGMSRSLSSASRPDRAAGSNRRRPPAPAQGDTGGKGGGRGKNVFGRCCYCSSVGASWSQLLERCVYTTGTLDKEEPIGNSYCRQQVHAPNDYLSLGGAVNTIEYPKPCSPLHAHPQPSPTCCCPEALDGSHG